MKRSELSIEMSYLFPLSMWFRRKATKGDLVRYSELFGSSSSFRFYHQMLQYLRSSPSFRVLVTRPNSAKQEPVTVVKMPVMISISPMSHGYKDCRKGSILPFNMAIFQCRTDRRRSVYTAIVRKINRKWEVTYTQAETPFICQPFCIIVEPNYLLRLPFGVSWSVGPLVLFGGWAKSLVNELELRCIQVACPWTPSTDSSLTSH